MGAKSCSGRETSQKSFTILSSHFVRKAARASVPLSVTCAENNDQERDAMSVALHETKTPAPSTLRPTPRHATIPYRKLKLKRQRQSPAERQMCENTTTKRTCEATTAANKQTRTEAVASTGSIGCQLTSRTIAPCAFANTSTNCPSSVDHTKTSPELEPE